MENAVSRGNDADIDIDRAYRLFFGAVVRGGIGPLVRLAYKLLGRPIVVGDEVGSLVMLWPDVDMDEPAWHEMYASRTIPHEGFLEVDEEYRARPVEPNRVVVVRGRFLYAGTQAMVRFEHEGKAVGFLSINYGDEEPGARELEVAQIFADALRPELVRLHERGREREEYLLQLLREKDRESTGYKLAATEIARKYPGAYRVLYVEDLPRGAASSVEAIRRRVNRSPVNAIAVDLGAALVMLEFRVGGDGSFDRGLASALEGYPVQTGRSTRFESPAMIPDYLVQAQATLEVGRMRDAGRRIYEYGEYAPLQLFRVCARDVDLSVFVHPAVRALQRYDAEHGTGLVETLEAFLLFQGNRGKTAERLSVHPNTLAYRLRRIEEVAGVDYDDPRVMAELAVSLLAAKFSRL